MISNDFESSYQKDWSTKHQKLLLLFLYYSIEISCFKIFEVNTYDSVSSDLQNPNFFSRVKSMILYWVAQESKNMVTSSSHRVCFDI